MTKLERVYQYYRKRYFGTRLPKQAKVRWRKIPHLGHWDGEEIVLNRAYRRDDTIWRLTLLHEMVHMSLDPDFTHGRTFQREMLRLAKLGAFRTLW